MVQKLSEILTVIDSYIGSSAWFVYLLLGVGLFFTFYLKFPQIRFFKHAFNVVTGKFDKSSHKGDTSHFGALTTALSGTVGTGNIAGVALAIHLGGPSAIFWMLVTAFLGMTTKMVEVTLSHKYREVTEDGTISGGPMYYMKNRLKMKPLAVMFAIATILSAFGTGNFPQINSIANAFESAFGINKVAVGIVLAILLGMVILGGIKRISQVTARLVPTMTVIYFLGGISVLIANYDEVLPSIASIFTSVFTGTAATGGFLGASVAMAFNRGVNRGLFSNEAGQGSAPIAHAAARTDEPVSEGMVSILEPFIDTIIVCFTTAVVLLSSGVWHEKHQNIFQEADLTILEGMYDRTSESDKAKITNVINGKHEGKYRLFNGQLNSEFGYIMEFGYTVIHARSVAENVVVYQGEEPYSGVINIRNGKILDSSIKMRGESLLHSAPLTTEAFGNGLIGHAGRFVIPICLLLFAFSTAIAWSYYGDRAVTFLFGSKYVVPFRVLYIIGFFVGAFADTTLLWIFSGITVAFMTIPNLIGIVLLHKDMKRELNDYTKKYNL